jgi:DNA repair exonuclease SbcCD ATPase subunit
MGKILIIVSIVLAAASAGVGFVNRSHLLKTKDDLAASQQETVTVKNNLEGEIKKYVEADKTISELTAQKQSLDSDLAKQKSDLSAKTTQLTETQSKLTKAEGELATANTDILTKGEKITQLESQLAAAATAVQTPVSTEEDKAAIAKLEQEKEDLIKDNENLTTKLASLQKAAREKETKQGLTRVTGRVLAVNQAWNFVVLSLGNKSGIDSNMEFLVKRGSTLIGKVRTTTVEPSTSIADIIPASLARGLSIQPGDDIIYQTAQNESAAF